jgi:hypothetical protein
VVQGGLDAFGLGQDLPLGGAVRIADGDPHEEPVELAFREGVGTVVLQRILRRHHEKRPR